MSFMNDLENLNDISYTENGAAGYKTTHNALLDLNFAASSLRNMDSDKIIQKFIDAYIEEDQNLVIRWLFFLRDIRGGMGERRSFRVILNFLGSYDPKTVKKIIPLVGEYGRYDDLFCLFGTEVEDQMVSFVTGLLTAEHGTTNNISLLAKWMPSAKSKKVYAENGIKYSVMARVFANAMDLSLREYSKMLAEMRKRLDVVEVKMSAGQWQEIDYEAVPSKANLSYKNAFLRHDQVRRTEYLNELARPNSTTKINSKAAFPHDIVHSYMRGSYYHSYGKEDATLEAMWQALPDYVDGDSSTLVVADGSGSMCTSISGTNVTCLEVANALAIYFAERAKGEYKDKFITFSERPQLVHLNGTSLKSKINICRDYDEIASTNIEAVFDLILRVAIRNHYKQEDIPQNILILSDMEFNEGVCSNKTIRRTYWRTPEPIEETLFETIAERYSQYGYKLPRLVFWNLCSRTLTVPVKENEHGVALVSGFSPAIMRMVLSGDLDPYENLKKILMSDRYDKIGKSFA